MRAVVRKKNTSLSGAVLLTALALAVFLLLIDLLVIVFGPISARTPAMIGFFGLLIAAQIIILWANRDMVTAFTKAQRYYLDEDFQSAREILEDLRQRDKADVRALTLLGNLLADVSYAVADPRLRKR